MADQDSSVKKATAKQAAAKAKAKARAAATELVRLRNQFYRDGYRYLIIVVLFCVMIITVLAGTAAYLYLNQPEPRYFATGPDGRLIDIAPLNRPNIALNNLRTWVGMSLLDIFDYNFLNYNQKLGDIQKFFTQKGYDDYIEKFRESKILETVLANKLIIKATMTDTPTLVYRGVVRIDGRPTYAWRWRVPLVMQYVSASERENKPIDAIVTVQRVPTSTDPRGFGIQSLVLVQREARSGTTGGATELLRRR